MIVLRVFLVAVRTIESHGNCATRRIFQRITNEVRDYSSPTTWLRACEREKVKLSLIDATHLHLHCPILPPSDIKYNGDTFAIE